ncbi:MAG: squalene/phytoene synthase family protein [Deltaproteobacteria bacterium]|nr:squalene/phytoene synthase family protein [Deltaproteobacteria bacterium]
MTATGSTQDLLSSLLSRVSRSFYLSLRILPREVRQPIGVAYLFCRAADTIADTALLPAEQRLACLDRYRRGFSEDPAAIPPIFPGQLLDSQQNPDERELLLRLPDCFAVLAGLPREDRRYIRELVLTLTQGMQMDLRLFPSEDSGTLAALETRADLDRYTYFVAGCVGEFWTKVTTAHVPSLQSWNVDEMAVRGVRFGKGLQLTNILRDIAQDVRIGRCYLPREGLARLGVCPEELLDSRTLTRVKPLLLTLLDETLALYRDGWRYTLAIPPREWRLRLACAWPLLIGLATLAAVKNASHLLEPTMRVKISRRQVYRILFRSLVAVWSDSALDGYYRQLLGRLADGKVV